MATEEAGSFSSRREFINQAGLYLGAALFGTAAAEAAGLFVPKEIGMDSADRPLSSLEDFAEAASHRIFQPGTSVPGPVPVDIPKEGWTLTVYPRQAYALAESTGSDIGAATPNTLSNPADSVVGKVQNEVMVSRSQGARLLPKTIEWRVRPTTTDELKKRPGRQDEGAADAIQYYVKDRLGFDAAFRLAWFDGPEKRTDLVDRSRDKVVSEQPLDPAVHAHLSRTMNYYQDYLPDRTPVLLVPKAEAGPSGPRRSWREATTAYEPAQDLVTIPAAAFSESDFVSYGLSHEMNRLLFFDFQSRPENTELENEFETVWSSYVEPLYGSSGYSEQACAINYSNLLQVFDESTYLGADCAVGRPGSLPVELFDSGLNCMRHFEAEMAGRIGQLSLADRSAAGQLTSLILRITDRITAQAQAARPLIPAASPLRKL